jgi:YrbI family 3-deoxy-D-manno-octulosonate 8-phosphate phosphatase
MVELNSRLARIKMLVMDVDGVLTDAGMYYSEDGNELKKFNTRDGKGIELLHKAGIKTAIITSEETKIVARRAEKLKIDDLYQGARNKLGALKEIAAKHALKLEEIAYIGDDVNDLEVMEAVGLAVSVADGLPQVKKSTHYVTEKKGGEGAVRELADMILQAKSS